MVHITRSKAILLREQLKKYQPNNPNGLIPINETNKTIFTESLSMGDSHFEMVGYLITLLFCAIGQNWSKEGLWFVKVENLN